MNPNQFTLKLQEALQAAQSLASEFNHAEIGSAHVLLALLEQSEGVTRPVAGLVLGLSHRRFAACAAAPALLLLVSSVGLGHWSALGRAGEVVIGADGQHALYAPLPGAQAHFALPEGSVVHTVESTLPWRKIEVDGRLGWVRDEVCIHVDPVRSGGGR